MKKKIVVLVVVILLLASTIQVAFADPPWEDPYNFGACNMGASWWAELVWDEENQIWVWVPLPGPGNAPEKTVGERGMYNVHLGTNPSNDDGSHPQGYTNGATHMDLITELDPDRAHCAEVPPE